MSFLTVQSLKKHYDIKGSFMAHKKTLRAVDGIDFSIEENSIFALVGESGCGKSTVARLVLRLLAPTAGRILFKGRDILGFKGAELQEFRKSVQIIFQDPFASLNPRKTVFDTVSEPLRIHRLAKRHEMRTISEDLLNKVGLGKEVLDRYPHEFSGGQRQRICIARALAVSPKLIVADEPLSALDVSIQAQVLNLLSELKAQARLSFLFISHDLKVVHYFSDYVGVMYLGKIVEQAKTEELFEKPLHPYTEILLASAPRITTKDEAAKDSSPHPPHSPISFDIGEIPSPINIPAGCPFHPRCPKRIEPCDKEVPGLKAWNNTRLVACHLWPGN